MRRLISFSLIMVCGLFLGFGEGAFAQQSVLQNEEQPTIQVIVQASTWKTRGRLLYDVEGSILKKLSLAGFRAVQDKKKPHQYQLVVQYALKGPAVFERLHAVVAFLACGGVRI